MKKGNEMRSLDGSQVWTEYPDRVIYDHAAYYVPLVAEDGRVGYRVSTLDGSRETFIYLNPSVNPDGSDEANVFVYEGIENDPDLDEPVVFVTPDALAEEARQ